MIVTFRGALHNWRIEAVSAAEKRQSPTPRTATYYSHAELREQVPYFDTPFSGSRLALAFVSLVARTASTPVKRKQKRNFWAKPIRKDK
jgi:hypothetical protein